MELYFCPNPRRYLGKLKLGATYVRSKTAGAVMFRPITVAAVLSITLGAIGAANAATYCASGGPDRATSRSQCTFRRWRTVAQASRQEVADVATRRDATPPGQDGGAGNGRLKANPVLDLVTGSLADLPLRSVKRTVCFSHFTMA